MYFLPRELHEKKDSGNLSLPLTDIKSSLRTGMSCKIGYTALNIDFISQPFFSAPD